MKLRKLSFKNFKSYSNAMTEIDFESDSSLNLILGENGTGKTSIAECVTYLLYGNIEHFTSADIPNRINKNFYGKIELECDGHNVVIERGLNPGLFKVQIDGNVVDTAGKSNVQTMLEESYFRIPYSVFHNILVLEIGEVKSLLSMNPADKRNIIDKICGFTIYNKYLKVIKEEAKLLEAKISTNSGSINAMMYNIEQYELQIEDVKKNATSQEEIDELTQKINEVKKIKEDNDVILTKIRKAGDELKTTNIKNSSEYNNLKEKIFAIDKKIALIDGKKCPTCGSSFETEEFQSMKQKLIDEKNTYKDMMNKILETSKQTKKRLELLSKKEQELKKKNNQLRLEDLKSDLMFKKKINEKNTTSIETLKNNIVQELEKLKDERKSLDDEKECVDFLLNCFNDNGVKKYISNDYIPAINSILAEMIQYMNLDYTLTFNSNFDATIKQNGMNVKYATLSKGEKRRVDFAAVISFIKFLKLQFGELNLLFLDEIFSNVDINGVDNMIDILRTLSTDMNLNIYLIHHARLEGVLFDKIIKTIKVDGFSRIEFI